MNTLVKTFLLLFILFLPVDTLANGISMQVDPILVQQVAQPGGTVKYTLNVENGDRFNSMTVDIAFADVWEDLNGVYGLKPVGSTRYSIADWVKVEPKQLTIPAGAVKEVSVVVNVPRGVSGGRYGAIVISPAEEKQTESPEELAATVFKFQAVSFLELSIASANRRLEAYPVGFELKTSAEFQNLRPQVGDNALVFSVFVENKGDIHIITQGRLIIRTLEGRRVAEYPLGGGRGVIIPEATVAMRTVIPPQLPPGEYQARAMIEYGGRRPLISELKFTVNEDKVEAESATKAILSRFVVQPGEIQTTLRAGAYKQEVIEVTNTGDEAIELTATILPLAFDLNGDLLPEGERGECPGWIQLSESSFTLEPGKSKRVRLSLQPPRDAKGGHYADILFKSGKEGSHTEAGINLLTFVGESDQVEKSGKVEIVGVQEVEKAINLDLLFTNESLIHVNTAVELVLNRVYPQIEEADGRIIASKKENIAAVEVPSAENPVLPGQQRAFSFLLPTDLQPGQYEVDVRIDYGGGEPAITKIGFEVKGGEDSE